VTSYIYIPPSFATAFRHLLKGEASSLKQLPKREFLKVYCSTAYCFPGFHPDCITDWDGPSLVKRITREAWRRAAQGELTDNELYPYQASKAAVVQR
jgi:hypothetical protein